VNVPDGFLDGLSRITGIKPTVPRERVDVSPDEDMAVRTVIGEAKGEGARGWQAVAGVIRNRSRQAKQSFRDVVLAPNQFEPWGARRRELEAIDPSSSTYRQVASAILPVLRGEAGDPTGGATHFYAPKAQAALGRAVPSWDNGHGMDIGNHRFFKLNYSGNGREGGTQETNTQGDAFLSGLKNVTTPQIPTGDDFLAGLQQLASVPSEHEQPSRPDKAPDTPAQTAVQPPTIPTSGPTNPSTVFLPPQAASQAPVPEHPDTIQAQIDAASDPKVKARAAVLTTDLSQNALFGNRTDFVMIPTPNGNLWVNKIKARKLKLRTPEQIGQFIERNPSGVQRLTGTAEDVGNNTGAGNAVLTTDPTGRELSAKIITNPQSAKTQVALDKNSFPHGQSQIVPAQAVVQQRVASQPVEQPSTPDGELPGYRDWLGYMKLDDGPDAKQQTGHADLQYSGCRQTCHKDVQGMGQRSVG
jgi:hypothetical protein